MSEWGIVSPGKRVSEWGIVTGFALTDDFGYFAGSDRVCIN